jgi:hypothetical protein
MTDEGVKASKMERADDAVAIDTARRTPGL